MMKTIGLAQTITILANLGVIAGIVLLVVEIRQNNELMEAQARATMVSLNSEIWALLAE